MNKTRRSTLLYGIVGFIALIFIITGFNSVFEVNGPGEITVVVTMGGSTKVKIDEGWMLHAAGRVEKYRQEYDYHFIKNITFNDQAKGNITGSFRYKMPLQAEQIKKIHRSYGSRKSFESDLIGNTIDNAIYATGPLLSSTESIVEKRNDLRVWIEDQAKNGIYRTVTKPVVEIDPSTKKEQIVNVTNPVMRDGEYVRVSTSASSEFGVGLYKLSIDSIRYDNKVEEQRDARMAATLAVEKAKALALAAEQDAIKAEAQARKDVAEALAKKQVAFENSRQELRQDSMEAVNNLYIATNQAKTDKVEADAAYYIASKKIQAGLTPQEKAYWAYRSDSIWAANVSKIKLPANYIQSDGKNKSSLLEQLTVLQMLQNKKK